MTHNDRKGGAIEVGAVCTFYGWSGDHPTLRVNPFMPPRD